jgi:hypothetical protein
MYGELASVTEIVDLSTQEALDRAESFLIQEGYTLMRRAVNSLIVYKRPPGQATGQNTLNLTVAAVPQPGGGVRIKVRGTTTDRVCGLCMSGRTCGEMLPQFLTALRIMDCLDLGGNEALVEIGVLEGGVDSSWRSPDSPSSSMARCSRGVREGPKYSV